MTYTLFIIRLGQYIGRDISLGNAIARRCFELGYSVATTARYI